MAHRTTLHTHTHTHILASAHLLGLFSQDLPMPTLCPMSHVNNSISRKHRANSNLGTCRPLGSFLAQLPPKLFFEMQQEDLLPQGAPAALRSAPTSPSTERLAGQLPRQMLLAPSQVAPPGQRPSLQLPCWLRGLSATPAGPLSAELPLADRSLLAREVTPHPHKLAAKACNRSKNGQSFCLRGTTPGAAVLWSP